MRCLARMFMLLLVDLVAVGASGLWVFVDVGPVPGVALLADDGD